MHFFSKTLLRAGGRLHFEARGATAARPQPETWKRPNITAAERFRYLYSEDELRGWVGPILALAEQAEPSATLVTLWLCAHAPPEPSSAS
jgi:hypothetical protein